MHHYPETVMAKPATELTRRLRRIAVALVVVFVVGVVGYMALEGWSFLDALYMTVVTLTTVGFREARPLDATGKVFTIVLLLTGAGLALMVITVGAQALAEGQPARRARRRRMQRDIDRLEHHTIICAYGRVGRAVANALQRASHPFVVIEIAEEQRHRMESDGVLFLVDDPSSEAVLRAAGVERARSLVCAVDSDATNVYITLIARSLAPDLAIVARASEPDSPERLERAGATRVVSPFVTSGEHMALMAVRPDVIDVAGEASRSPTGLGVEERVVSPGSSFVGRGIAEAGLAVLAVRRATGEVIANPAPDTTLQAGDTVLVLAGSERAGRRSSLQP